MCSTHMSVKPVKLPRKREHISRNNGLTFILDSSFDSLMPSSEQSAGRHVSTSPTTCENSLYNGSRMNSTKLRCADPCDGFLVNLRVRELK